MGIAGKRSCCAVVLSIGMAVSGILSDLLGINHHQLMQQYSQSLPRYLHLTLTIIITAITITVIIVIPL